MKSPASSLIAVVSAFAVLAGIAFNDVANAAATLIDNAVIQVTSSTNPTALISVNPGNEGWSSDSATLDETFNNPIVAYALFNDSSTPVASSGGLISDLSANSGADNRLSFWTTNNPNTDAPNLTGAGVRWTPDSTFNVDISGLTAGSIYIFNGSWQARTDWVNVAMTGAGQPTITDHAGGSIFGLSPAVTGASIYAKRIDFAGAAAYDTITFTLRESSGTNSGYFAGVVVTAIPEPSFALLGSIGLCLPLLLRRRR